MHYVLEDKPKHSAATVDRKSLDALLNQLHQAGIETQISADRQSGQVMSSLLYQRMVSDRFIALSSSLRFPIRLMIISPVLIFCALRICHCGGPCLCDTYRPWCRFILGEPRLAIHGFVSALAGNDIGLLGLWRRSGLFNEPSHTLCIYLGPPKPLRSGPFYLLGLASLVCRAGLRALAIKSNVWFSIELMILVFGCGYAFAPHRDGQIMQPLWLSDWAWKQGLEPTLVLGVLGSVLICILAVLAILDRARRIPISILLLPILVLLALISLDPKSLWFDVPPPSGIDGLRDDSLGQPPPQGARGGASRSQ